jgi:predicted DNA-binding transcriptional regulator AlpA
MMQGRAPRRDFDDSTAAPQLDTPTLDDLARNPAQAASLPVEVRGSLIIRAAAVLAALGVGLIPPRPSSLPIGDLEDRYLTMAEVRARTGLSRSYLYQLARTGGLPVKPLGKRRGYRVLLSQLRDWEHDRARNPVDERLNKVLSAHRGRQRVPAASTEDRPDAGTARSENRRA